MVIGKLCSATLHCQKWGLAQGGGQRYAKNTVWAELSSDKIKLTYSFH